MDKLEAALGGLTEILASTVTGRYAVAVAGAHAKGAADQYSDIDIFMYIEEPKPYEERRRIIEKAADPDARIWVTPDFHDGAWGGSMDFTYQGTPVETTVRLLPEFEPLFAQTLEGKYQVIDASWTTNGYYTYICLSEIDFIQPVTDPWGILTGYKARAAVYPEKLRRAILRDFTGRSGAWLDSFHYTGAIEREDFLFTGPIVQATVLNMVQVIFALNRVYFHGDKKLERQLLEMEYCPDALLKNLELLFSAARNREHLALQRRILKEVQDELAEKVRNVTKEGESGR